ncbi:YraN family protein [Lysobacter sp. D1-1-M9]|uniref:YraN family protein n=1 Tax=Novilysobacter longmucuonensis TaxID=3098603 RepID=UPI002FC5A839
MRDVIDRRSRGAAVEAAARVHLQAAGLRLVAANATFRAGELDLVMFDDGRQATSGGQGAMLVFVEVRYRRSAAFGGGAASIDAGKRRKLVRAAQAFLLTHRQYANAACRFDVVEAQGDPAAPTLTWLRDAFRADDC